MIESKKLIIIGARDKLMWYADKIGEEVDYVITDHSGLFYWAKETDRGWRNIVWKTDAYIKEL